MAEPQRDFFRALAETLIRVWAGGVIIFNVATLVSYSFVSWGEGVEARNDRVVFLGAMLGQIVIGFVFWFAANRVAKLAVPKASESFAIPSGLTTVSLVSIGCFLVGLFYVVEYGPRAIVQALNFLYENGKPRDGTASRNFIYIPDLIANWAGLLTALLVAVNAKNLARLFSWLRTADIKPDEDRDGAPPDTR